MKFTASRLSEGNKIFPSEIHIEPTGVTVKIPGLFGGDSKFFDFHHIASVDVKSPMIGYATVTFYAGGTQISAHGFTNSEVKEMKQAIENGKKRGPVSSNSADNNATGANAGTTIINKAPSALSILASQMDSSAKYAADDARKHEEKMKLQGKVEDLATLQFGADKEDISNKLNYLSGLGTAKPDKQIKNVIIDKMEFGIMKLRGLGANDEAAYFEKKLEPLKKKGWF